MGRTNQQRRAAKAKERRRRAAADDARARATYAGPGAFLEMPSPVHSGSVEQTIVEELSDVLDALVDGADESAEILMRRLLRRQDTPRHAAVVTDELSAVLEASVSMMWPRGWRPVDLHHIVVRELDGPAQAVLADVMAAELSAYAVVTLAPDWPSVYETYESQLRIFAASPQTA